MIKTISWRQVLVNLISTVLTNPGQISRLTFTCKHIQFEWLRLLHHANEAGIKFFQLWRSSRHSRLPHGREQQSIEQPALPAGRMYSLPTAGLEYIMSIAINSLLLYWFRVTRCHYQVIIVINHRSTLNPNFIPLWWIFLTYKYQLSPRALHLS